MSPTEFSAECRSMFNFFCRFPKEPHRAARIAGYVKTSTSYQRFEWVKKLGKVWCWCWFHVAKTLTLQAEFVARTRWGTTRMTAASPKDRAPPYRLGMGAVKTRVELIRCNVPSISIYIVELISLTYSGCMICSLKNRQSPCESWTRGTRWRAWNTSMPVVWFTRTLEAQWRKPLTQQITPWSCRVSLTGHAVAGEVGECTTNLFQKPRGSRHENSDEKQLCFSQRFLLKSRSIR